MFSPSVSCMPAPQKGGLSLSPLSPERKLSACHPHLHAMQCFKCTGLNHSRDQGFFLTASEMLVM